jgi:hypothetical protein
LKTKGFPGQNPEIRHPFWILFWFKGEFIPSSIRPFTPENPRFMGTERLILRSDDDC